MAILSDTFSAPRPDAKRRSFRSVVRKEDAEAADALARASGVFNEGEACIARELIDDHLVKGADGSGYYFLLADGPGRLDAMVCFGPIPATEHRAEMYWIDVHPDARRDGLGSQIEAAMEEVLIKNWNIKYLVCQTSSRPDYAPARNFYRSRGFVQVAEIPHWYADDDNLCFFRKELR
jgi:ribosomal protein S18 acetylase RimI-like enzyme